MVRCRALNKRWEGQGSSADSPRAANDDPAIQSAKSIPSPTWTEVATPVPAPANDDWIEADLPIRISVLAEEITLLDQFLRPQILALFD